MSIEMVLLTIVLVVFLITDVLQRIIHRNVRKRMDAMSSRLDTQGRLWEGEHNKLLDIQRDIHRMRTELKVTQTYCDVLKRDHATDVKTLTALYELLNSTQQDHDDRFNALAKYLKVYVLRSMEPVYDVTPMKPEPIKNTGSEPFGKVVPT